MKLIRWLLSIIMRLGLSILSCRVRKTVSAVLSTVFGTGNAGITYTLKDGVSTASIAHAAVDADATAVTVDVATDVVSVTPGGIAALFITGVTDINGHALPVLAIPYGGIDAENSDTQWWASTTYSGVGWTVSWMGQDSAWQVRYDDGAGNTASFYTGTATGKLPTDPSLTWAVDQSGSGTPTVSGGSSAAQVLTALNASDPAKALLTFALVGTGSAAVSTHAAVTLHT
ncbi:MAG: hypothetical protein WCO57_04635 [Verrucomicrobiota bacterium]